MGAIKEKKLSNTELSAFCGQMSLILSSGISATEGISTMLEESDSEAERAILQGITDNMITCYSLHDAMEQTGVFPKYMLAMVKLGEETGTLDEVFDSLSHYYEREEEVSRAVRSAVIYPAIMAAMMLIVIIVLLVVVLPIFNQVYAQLGTEMTGISQVLLNIGNGIGRWGLIVLIVIAAIALICFIISRFEGGRKFFSNLGYKLGIMKKSKTLRATSRLASGLATGLKSGLDMNESLILAADLNEEPALEEVLSEAKRKVADGEDAEKALKETGLFGGIYSKMLSVGIKTGAAPQVLEQISDMNQNEVDTRLGNTLAALEPTIVIVLSVLVGVILLSVMLPLLGIISGI